MSTAHSLKPQHYFLIFLFELEIYDQDISKTKSIHHLEFFAYREINFQSNWLIKSKTQECKKKLGLNYGISEMMIRKRN